MIFVTGCFRPSKKTKKRSVNKIVMFFIISLKIEYSVITQAFFWDKQI